MGRNSRLKNNKTKKYYDRDFHGKTVSKDKRKRLPTKTRSTNALCGREINTLFVFASIDMLWKLDGKKFVSLVLQEVLFVTISERMFKGRGIWQRQRQPSSSFIISDFFLRKTKSNFSLLWKLLRTFFSPKTMLLSPRLCMKRSLSC